MDRGDRFFCRTLRRFTFTLLVGVKGRGMVSFASWLLILWICYGIGAAALPRLRANSAGLGEELPFACALGLGFLSYSMLALGFLGYLKPGVALLLLVLFAVIGRKHLFRLLRELPREFSSLHPWRASVLPMSLFLLLVFLLTLLGALAPAPDSDYDSLVYHLAIPKVYLRDGNIHFLPWLSHSNFPFSLEMLYTLGLLLRDQSLAKLFHFGCGWLTILAIFNFARRWWSARAGWLGACIFAAIPLVAWQLTTAYIELGLALYVFLALYALARYREEQQPGWLWVAGLMAGWALGIKMLGGAVLLFLLIILLWDLRADSNRLLHLRRAAAFALIAIALAAPWYVKSYLWTGNPVYPFFYELFDGRYWTAERARLYTNAQHAFGLGRSPLAFLALPWNLTMRARWFFDQPQVLRPFNLYVFAFGPLLLCLLPTLLLTGPVGAAGRLALLFGLFFGAIWFGLTQNGRYLIPLLPSLAVCAGFAADRLLAHRGLLSAAALLALSLGFLLGLHPIVLLNAPAARVALGLESKAAYLTRVSQSYRIFTAITDATPPTAKLILFGDEPRAFYLNRDYLFGDHAEIFTPTDLANPRAFLAALQRLGVTHLVIHASTLRNMETHSGTLESRLAELAAQGDLVNLGTYETVTLWEMRNEDKNRA